MIERELASLRTIPESLHRAAEAGTGITFVSAKGEDSEIPYAKIEQRARELAGVLRSLGVEKGDRVALVLPDEREFVHTVFAVWLAGAAAVPLAPPLDLRQAGSYSSNTTALIQAAGAELAICPPAIGALLPRVHSMPFSELTRRAGEPFSEPVGLQDLALVQFTSGSTAAPKGVALTHGNLGANCAVVNFEGLKTGPGDRTASWLPLFHDMGLIGFILCPMYNALPATLMPPLAFLARPASWLQMLARLRATITFAPNFAFAYAAKRVRDEQLEGVDLSCVRVMGCGAEPIQERTLRQFADRFARFGFSEESFYPSYGLAESSLAVSFGRGIVTDRFESGSLVACGPAFGGHGIEIVDPKTSQTLAERHVGEIRLRGPSVMNGYLEDPVATSAAFDPSGRLKTGDLGYLADGQLFVCGRIKDTIIVRGRNYHPHDIEWAAANVAGVRPGCVAAFGVHEGGEEHLCVVAEAKKDAAPDELRSAIRDAVGEATGLVVDRIEIVPARTVRKTSSGKIRRQEMRKLYERGELKPERGSLLAMVKPLARLPWVGLRARLSSRP